MTKDNNVLEDKKLSKVSRPDTVVLSREETQWLQDEAEDIIGFGGFWGPAGIWDFLQIHELKEDQSELFEHKSKKDWIVDKYDRLVAIGLSNETACMIIMEATERRRMLVSHGYIRSCIRNRSGYELGRNVRYNDAYHIQADKVRKAYMDSIAAKGKQLKIEVV
jgi:hypothetical protein